MAKYLLLLLCCLLRTVPMQAQHFSCGTPPLTEAERQVILQRILPVQQQLASRPAGTVNYVPIKLHMVRRDDGTGGLTALQVMSRIAECNRSFIASGIQFYFCGTVNEINSTRFFDDFNPSIEPLICPQNDGATVLNMYMVNKARIGNFQAGGYAYFPGGPRRLIITYGSGAGVGVYEHEMGHIFGLPHTQQDSNNPNTALRELVRRTNCATTGDLICDTAADPYDRPGATSSGCHYTGTITDALGDLYLPPTTNTMSYWCGLEFTPEQYARMRAARAASYAGLSCGAVSPGAPTALLATATVSSIELRWAASPTPVLGYYIERASSPTGEFASIGMAPPTTTTFTDTKPLTTVAFYRVKPVNAEASFSNVVSATMLPLALGNFGATHQGTQAQLSWSTLVERDNVYFEVEATPAGGAARSLGRVTAPTTTTPAQRTYALADPQFLTYNADSVHYRLLGVGGTGLVTQLAVQTLRPKTLQFLTFKGEHQDDQATLSWTTGEEYGNAYFEVEVRPRQGTFKPLAKINSLPLNGPNAIQNYALADRQLLFYATDTAYYRVSGTTAAGKTSVLTTKAVPVRKIDFRGLTGQYETGRNIAALRWVTGEEFGTTQFEVDVRPAGGPYRLLSRLEATPGMPSKPHEYALEDPAFLLYQADSVYYRLRGINRAAQTTTLATLGLRVALGNTFALQAAPNPFQATIQVQVVSSRAGIGEVVVHNALGHILVRTPLKLAAGLTLLTIPAQPTWAVGIYFLSVRQQGAIRTMKLMKAP
ncbi:zinc-dependent metalloprotease [Hymenobacter elongatus]|uniref:T9SS type A sorting domain-containing protein n=1 Tax=Hymenobacter elongatus TaxID=877208 RepID=A0A4Z0PJD7_9BACT|nr:zinc-dependent metalloprotease [Hymenobacter elongatus]TGE15408.1 T9SS type A sorting domain-containing protein [Hymenobacter elongatus]